MSTIAKLGNEFLCILKLDLTGSNWVIFKEQFLWALDACSILDHIDGTSKEPPANPIPKEDQDSGKLTKVQGTLEVEWRKELKEWKQSEAVAKQQITSSIPDSLFMKIYSKLIVYEIWTSLKNHFQKRS